MCNIWATVLEKPQSQYPKFVKSRYIVMPYLISSFDKTDSFVNVFNWGKTILSVEGGGVNDLKEESEISFYEYIHLIQRCISS